VLHKLQPIPLGKTMKPFSAIVIVACLIVPVGVQAAESDAPWGSASEIHQVYSKQKVVFDTTSGSLAGLASVLDRASYISQLNGPDPFDTRIVIVLHGEAIPFFAIKNFSKYRDLMIRAQSLSVGNVIEFRMCKAAARLQGLTAKDIHGFVRLVPMADAEIVRLQQEEGFAYMR
jgi:intracellular sulfur oxidation DsrE/DsrF family protein